MAFKDETERKFGKTYAPREWWNKIGYIMENVQPEDVYHALKSYFATGDESMLTPKRKEFIHSYFDYIFE